MKSIASAAALALATWLAFAGPAMAEASRQGTIYKNPWCACCSGHADYLRDHGFELGIVNTEALDAIRAEHGVPAELAGCHLIIVDGYVIEGHVPAAVIDRLLLEQPDIIGISLPGMPQGSPGMAGTKEQPFVILEISGGAPAVFAIE